MYHKKSVLLSRTTTLLNVYCLAKFVALYGVYSSIRPTAREDRDHPQRSLIYLWLNGRWFCIPMDEHPI